MPIYKGTMEITKIADLLTATEHQITEVFFGDKQVFTVWGEYDGSLPATYSANGSMLADYRIYGAAGGVGDDSGTEYGYVIPMSVSDGSTATTTPIYIGSDPLGEDEYVSFKEQKVYRRTENLFNYQSKNTENGYQDGKVIMQNGTTISNNLYAISEYIEVIEGFTYTWTFAINKATSFTVTAELLDHNKNRVSVVKYGAQARSFSFEVPPEVKYIRTSIYKIWANEALLTTFAPSSYIPYYNPQNPPVSLPALPTVDGVNVVDYAGQSVAVPERLYAKYRKEGY